MGLQAHWLTNVHHHSCKGVILLFIQEFQTREKSYIGLRLVMIFITFIHLQHLENSDDWIPMKYPLHTKPPTPVYASPTRFCGAQAIFDDPRNVNVCTVYPRVPAACIPPFRWLYKQHVARRRQFGVDVDFATRVRGPKGRLYFSLMKRTALRARYVRFLWDVFQTVAVFWLQRCVAARVELAA